MEQPDIVDKSRRLTDSDIYAQVIYNLITALSCQCLKQNIVIFINIRIVRS